MTVTLCPPMSFYTLPDELLEEKRHYYNVSQWGFFVVKFVKPLNVLLYASSIAVRLESICCIQEEVGE